jgi:hypothetical protein
VVVGSFAFLGFDGFFVVAAGVDVAPAGSTVPWLGLAPPVDAAGVGVAAGAGVATTAAEDVVVGAAAAVVVALLECCAGLCCLACRALWGALALLVAVVGVLVAAAGCALVFDFVEPPLPQPAATTATAATVQIRARFIRRTPFCLSEASVPGLQTRLRLQRFAATAYRKVRWWLLYTHRALHGCAFRGTIAGG